MTDTGLLVGGVIIGALVVYLLIRRGRRGGNNHRNDNKTIYVKTIHEEPSLPFFFPVSYNYPLIHHPSHDLHHHH